MPKNPTFLTKQVGVYSTDAHESNMIATYTNYGIEEELESKFIERKITVRSL